MSQSAPPPPQNPHPPPPPPPLNPHPPPPPLTDTKTSQPPNDPQTTNNSNSNIKTGCILHEMTDKYVPTQCRLHVHLKRRRQEAGWKSIGVICTGVSQLIVWISRQLTESGEDACKMESVDFYQSISRFEHKAFSVSTGVVFFFLFLSFFLSFCVSP